MCTPEGNILWDCISLIDDATVTLINGLGGLRAIAISHPHFYTTLVDWSRAFGNVPVHLHADDAKWVRQPDDCIKFWQGERFELLKGVTLVRGGGHFPGGAMLHWAAGAEGKGVVCSADIAIVNLDRKSFSFMRSIPNFIPLSEKGVRAVGGGADASGVRSGLQPPLRAGDAFGREADPAEFRGALRCGDRWRLRPGVRVRKASASVIQKRSARMTASGTKPTNLVGLGDVRPRGRSEMAGRWSKPTRMTLEADSMG